MDDREQPRTEFVNVLLAEARSETDKADTKAGIVLAALGIVVGALLAGLMAGDWSPLSLDPRVEWLWWLGASSIAVALAASASAVWPRFVVPARTGAIHYWGDASRAKSPRELAKRLGAEKVDETERAVAQLWNLSRIVVQKYRLVQAALALAATGFVLCSIAALLDVVI